MLCTIVFVLIGCDATWGQSSDNLQGTKMPATKQSDDAGARPIQWVLGPIGAGDAVRNIVFREPSNSKLPGGKRPQKIVVPRPMIQGAPGAIYIDKDGSQYVGGSFSGKRDFDTGLGFDFHEAVGTEDGFVTCFDRNGKHRWTRTFGAKEGVDVRGIAVSHGVVYAACDESGGHVVILAMDGSNGTTKSGFGHSGCQMFRCGEIDRAATIRSHGDIIYVAIRCLNILAGKLPPLAANEEPPAIKWPSYSFTVVLAIDRTSGSAVTGFGTNGVQTIGNAVALKDALSAKVSQTRVEPFALTVSGSTLYIVGSCDGSSLGTGGQGTMTAGSSSKAFIAALDTQTGAAVSSFGHAGMVLMDGDITEANDVVVSGGSLYLTGTLRHGSHEKAFLAAMDAGTGTLSQQFGTAGIKVFGPSDWESGWSIRVDGQVVYIAGSYINQRAEGVYVAAFDRTSGLPVRSFGTSGTRLIEGLSYGNQGRMGRFGDTLFLVARTEPSLESEKHEIMIGNRIIKHGDMNGFLFRLRKDGTVDSERGQND